LVAHFAPSRWLQHHLFSRVTTPSWHIPGISSAQNVGMAAATLLIMEGGGAVSSHYGHSKDTADSV